MPIHATMTGSWFRPKEIASLLVQSPTGELGPEHGQLVEEAERVAIREQLHPHGSQVGLTFVSNGEQRKAGYTNFLPNRFDGFSKTERTGMQFPPVLIQEFQESNPALLQALQGQQGGPFVAPVIESRLVYRGGSLAQEEARQAVRLAKEEKAPRIFVPSPSPGVTTIFFPRSGVYAACKAAVVGLTKSLAIDCVGDGVRVNAMCPGTVDSPSWRDRVAQSPNPEQALKDFIARQPMGRGGQPQEIAALAAHEKVRAIGETGIDYYRDTASPAEQRRAFEAQIEIAREAGFVYFLTANEGYIEKGSVVSELPRLNINGRPDLISFQQYIGATP